MYIQSGTGPTGERHTWAKVSIHHGQIPVTDQAEGGMSISFSHTLEKYSNDDCECSSFHFTYFPQENLWKRKFLPEWSRSKKKIKNRRYLRKVGDECSASNSYPASVTYSQRRKQLGETIAGTLACFSQDSFWKFTTEIVGIFPK